MISDEIVKMRRKREKGKKGKKLKIYVVRAEHT
jgi:hypothetical protein